MDASELRRRRKAAGLTQAGLGEKLGLHRDFIGLMERGGQPIAERTALAVEALEARRPPLLSDQHAKPVSTDPMERIVEQALIDAGIPYIADRDAGTSHRLDFDLPEHGVAIEVKRMHSPRISEQMARAENVIVAQGEVAVRLLADALRALR